MDGIDIFLINLKHRTDRKKQSLELFEKYNFNVHVFEAIQNSQGWKGCAESHMHLIKHAKENNMDYIVVAEDDIDILVDASIVDGILQYLGRNAFNIFNGSPTLWDVRKNTQSIHANTIDDSPNLATINWGQTTTFIVYHNSIYNYILENYRFDEAIDQFLSRMIKQTIYVGPTPFCKQRESYSDIQGRQSTYGDLFYIDHKKILSILNRPEQPYPTIGVYGIFIGTYKCLYKDWIDNITKLFFPGQRKNFYVITDDASLPSYNDTTFISVTEYIGWPYETLYRFKYFLNFRGCDIFASDIIYFINANGRFVLPVSYEVVPNNSNYVFTVHHGYVDKSYKAMTFEKDMKSSSYVSEAAGVTYYGGGFFGATTINFMQMSRILDLRISDDEKKGYIAVWHDESHLNWYANVLLKGTGRQLSVNFHVPQEYKNKYPNRILTYLHKNNKQLSEIQKDQYTRPRNGGRILVNKYNRSHVVIPNDIELKL